MDSVLQPGTILKDTYEIKKQIGQGGIGSIYLGYHLNLKTDIAIKKIHDNGNYDEDEVFREAAILTKLRHSYLPRVYDFLILESGVYTVMDYIPGQSLDQMLKQGHKFTEKEIIKYGRQLAEAVAYLHSQKPAIIHGDIKPANIMITPEGNVCLIDFNISGVADESGNAFVTGLTMDYAAPEQKKEFGEITNRISAAIKEWETKCNEQEKSETEETVHMAEPKPTPESLGIKGIHINERSDVFSIGATMYKLLTGELYKNNGNKTEVNVSDALVIILNKSLEEDPKDRYRNAGELFNALSNIYKLDKRYKRVIVSQQIVQCLFIVLIGLGFVTSFYGLVLKNKSNNSVYYNYIEQIQECTVSGDAEGAEEAFLSATDINALRLDAYIAKTEFLYKMGKYGEVINFVNDEVFTKNNLKNADRLDYLYFLLGRAYYEEDDKENALSSFSMAISKNSNESDYYIFSALSLADLGRISEAEDALGQAEKLDADTGYILLLKGEIAKDQGNNDQAINYFQQCIESTEDEYIKSRAYIFESDTYINCGATRDNYNKEIEILKEALDSLPDEYKALILSRLGNAYTNLYNITEDKYTAKNAISTYELITVNYVADFTIYNNIAVLYEKLGEYETAIATLKSIENLYSNYYALYKRMAFLEFEIQNSKSEGLDFTAFEEYYQKAEQLYSLSSKQNDTEMLLLQETYENYQTLINN